jgi:transketolase N-terminal domain/subunit
METKMTAVEYIIDVLATVIDKEYFKTEIDKAKAMEKEQIKDAWKDPMWHRLPQDSVEEVLEYTSEEYYNETYGESETKG